VLELITVDRQQYMVSRYAKKNLVQQEESWVLHKRVDY
jgi:hypothetical protein